MKVVSVVGARPQFIKAAPVSHALRKAGVAEILLHTGQHYDDEMSAIFFRELEIPPPDRNLGVGSGSHGSQTGQMLSGIEGVLLAEAPDWVVLYGDTNSTLAGALAASKLHIPIAHVEAGLRSFNRTMPEEINRVLTDHISSLLLCPTPAGVRNLAAEGVCAGVHLVGDVMYDAAMQHSELARSRPGLIESLGVQYGRYLLLTIHRPSNTETLEGLLTVLRAVAETGEPVIFPVHPRTRALLHENSAELPPNLKLISPVGYLDMLALEQGARMIVTDSGGMQKEAYFFSVPCITLREDTEWTETLECGWNRLTGAVPDRIRQAIRDFCPNGQHPPLFGDGHAADRIVQALTVGDPAPLDCTYGLSGGLSRPK